MVVASCSEIERTNSLRQRHRNKNTSKPLLKRVYEMISVSSRLRLKFARLISKVVTHVDSVACADLKLGIIEKLKICGRGVHFQGWVKVVFPENIELGNNVIIGNNAYTDARGGLIIGDNTRISRNLVLHTSIRNYESTRLSYDDSYRLKSVVIGSNVWIGTSVVIIPGIKIGSGAIIGAGTVVSKTVPALAIVGNQQIRMIKFRDEARYRELVSIKSYGGISGRMLEQKTSESCIREIALI